MYIWFTSMTRMIRNMLNFNQEKLFITQILHVISMGMEAVNGGVSPSIG